MHAAAFCARYMCRRAITSLSGPGPRHPPQPSLQLADTQALPPAAQGRDDVGRPLLERALAIQEAALGPDHPDVLAIRDVLESE
jgi:hypothetical protein